MEERLLALLRLALRYNASDIHFMVQYHEIKIELRIEGLCYKVKTKNEDFKLIRYLQYLANLDVGNILTPQTGQFEIDVDGILLSLRFAVINKLEYCNGVLRILNSRLKLDVDNLSSIKTQNAFFRSLLGKRCGLILFSGPTGSGKTTTLYSLLKSVKNKKIYTIEDPIEVYHDSFIQLNVNEKMSFDYEDGVKQILRHDPDIIMIGEIRDSKAAKIAVEAANTGHLVLSSIHTSRASSCISRMIELGVNEQHLYENLLCLSNQRMMFNNKTKRRMVLYEIMDRNEIEYFRKNHENSKDFLDIERQIDIGIRNGYFKENTV